MKISALLSSTIRIGAVCVLFAVCVIVGSVVSGMSRLGQPSAQPTSNASAVAAQQPQPAPPPAAAQAPKGFLLPFVTYCLCAGVVVSFLILRSRWSGWKLSGALFLAIYGISCVVNALEGAAFLSAKMPHGMIRAWLLQGAISTAVFAPLAVLVMGRWKGRTVAADRPGWPSFASALWRVAVIVVAFVFFYIFFGYFIAWQNPAVRTYYGGAAFSSFFAAWQGNWEHSRWIYPLATFRGLLYVAFLYPLVRMLRGTRWQTAVAMALFLAAWTVGLLLPNALMPPSVAHTHFFETFAFSLVLGVLSGWLLAPVDLESERKLQTPENAVSMAGRV